MSDLFAFFYFACKSVVGDDRQHLEVLCLSKTHHLNVTAETYHLLAYLSLESHDYGKTDNHDSQTYGYTKHSNTNSRTRKSFPVLCLIRIDAFCYE